MKAAWSLAGRAVGTSDRVGAGQRQPAHVFGKFHVVADQHAELQPAELDDAWPPAARRRTAASHSRRRDALCDRRARTSPSTKTRAVEDGIAVALGKSRDDRHARWLRARCRAGGHLRPVIGGSASAVIAGAGAIAGQGQFRRDQQAAPRPWPRRVLPLRSMRARLAAGSPAVALICKAAMRISCRLRGHGAEQPADVAEPGDQAEHQRRDGDEEHRHRGHGRRVAVAQRVEDLDRQRLRR